MVGPAPAGRPVGSTSTVCRRTKESGPLWLTLWCPAGPPIYPLHEPDCHVLSEIWPAFGCSRTGTGESPIKIVPRDADKDSYMALSDHLANRQGPERQFRPPVRHGSEEDHCCGQGTSFAFPRTLSCLLPAGSHDPGGTAVPSTQSKRDQHIWKVIGLPRAIR